MATCLTPLTLPLKEKLTDRPGYSTNKVPCGRCPNCLKTRVAKWQFRLEQEAKRAHTTAFITLTYSDEHLPANQSLQKSDIQKFFKRLRKNIDSWENFPNKIKYYAVGEYGTNTHRPHYHLILFNAPTFHLDNPVLLEKLWNLGHVRIDPCNSATIGYVTGYVMKKTSSGTYKHFSTTYNIYKQRYETKFKISNINPDDPRDPEFSIMSKHLGDNYLTDDVRNYHTSNLNSFTTLAGGTKLPLSQYYKDKIFTIEEKTAINREQMAHIHDAKPISERKRIEIIKDASRKTAKQIRLNREKL